MKTNDGYIRTSDPDKDELSKLITKAKGPGRTMKQFAIECGADPSTLSRIVNKKNSRPSSDKLIKSIAEHADPNSGVTLDAIMAAHGMARILDNKAVVKISGNEIEEMFRGALLHELGQSNRKAYIVNESFRVTASVGYNADIVVKSELVSGNGIWAFEVIPPQYNTQNGCGDPENRFSTNRKIKRMLEFIGMVLPLFYKNENGISKFSFVIADEITFNHAVSEFRNYCLPCNISIIFFDLENQIIENEFILKKPDGKTLLENIINTSGGLDHFF